MVHFFPLKYLFFLERHSYRETQSEVVQLLVYVPITVAAGAPWPKPGPEFTLATRREAQAQAPLGHLVLFSQRSQQKAAMKVAGTPTSVARQWLHLLHQ